MLITEKLERRKLLNITIPTHLDTTMLDTWRITLLRILLFHVSLFSWNTHYLTRHSLSFGKEFDK